MICVVQMLAGQGHAGRNLKAFMLQQRYGIEPTYIGIPVAKGRTTIERLWPVFAPHEVLFVFRTRLAATGRNPDFWETLQRTEPGFKDQAFQPDLDTLPLKLHADEGKFTSKRQIMICQFSTFFHAADPLDSRYLLFVMPGSLYSKTGTRNHTLNKLWEFLVWSFGYVVRGVWPTDPFPGSKLTKLGHSRRGLPMGIKGHVVAVRGDWKFVQMAFQQSHSWMHNDVCTRCQASRQSGTRVPFWDFSAGAAWRATLFTQAQTLQLFNSPLTLLPFFIPEMLWDDVMHSVFMGFGKDLVSSAIVLACYADHFGSGTLPAKLGRATDSWKSWCHVRGHSTTVTTIDRARLKFPSMGAVPMIICKAYDTKLLLSWLAETLSFVTAPASLCLAALATHSLCAMFHVLDCANLILTEEEAAAIIAYGDKFFEAYGAVSASMDGSPTHSLFPCRPKLHKVQCQVIDRIRKGSRINPRYMSCWADEGFVNPIARFSQQTKASQSGLQTLLRWNLYVLARWDMANWHVALSTRK
jgi:hypothetical protein